MIEFLKRNALLFFMGWNISGWYGTDYLSIGIFVAIFVVLLMFHDFAIEGAEKERVLAVTKKVIMGKIKQ